MSPVRDIKLAQRAHSHGSRYSLRIIREARAAGIRISLGFALVEQESNFHNVFGHDPTIFAGAGTATKAKYLKYKSQRGTRHMQGVGPCQLTWYETQDKADAIGGCWKPACNIRVAFQTLAANIKAHGYSVGIERYNGSGPAAVNYSKSVRARARAWHSILG